MAEVLLYVVRLEFPHNYLILNKRSTVKIHLEDIEAFSIMNVQINGEQSSTACLVSVQLIGAIQLEMVQMPVQN